MPENGRDDLADALARLAGGEVTPSEHLQEDPTPPPARPVTPKRPPAVKSAAPPRPTGPTGPTGVTGVTGAAPQTGAPAPARTVDPAARPVVAPEVAPARPVRPSAPNSAVSPLSPAATTTPGVRPQRPTLASVTPPPPAVEETPAGVVDDDDDAVIVPAYESTAAPRPVNAAAVARAKVAQMKRLAFKQTCIPVLLTTGVLLLLFASGKFLLGDESTWSALPNTIPALLASVGLVMLILAGVNMFSVAKELKGLK